MSSLELQAQLESAQRALETAIRIGERLQERVDRYQPALAEIATMKGEAAAIAQDALRDGDEEPA